MKRNIIIVILLNFVSVGAFAQLMKPDTTKRHFVNFNFGYDYNLISLNLGYSHFLPKYKTALFVDFTQGSALLGTGNFRTQIGLQSWIGSVKKFNLKTSLAFVHTKSANKAGVYNGIGMNLDINPGLNFNRIGVGLDIQYNPFIATHIKHSVFWKQYYFQNAKDGWYSFTANNIRIGAYISGQINKRKTIELNLKGGYQNNGEFDKLIPNIYFIFGLTKKI